MAGFMSMRKASRIFAKILREENAQALADAVMRLHDDESPAERLGKNGRDYVGKFYNRETLALIYLELLKGLSREHQHS
jgi:glycosyltransferase involved in cell wall biosynthesis